MIFGQEAVSVLLESHDAVGGRRLGLCHLPPERLDRPQGADVAVVAEDQITRAGIGAMLQQLPAVRRVVSCELHEEAVRALADYPVDVLVTPCIKPGSWMERLASVASSSGTKVLVVLDDDNVDSIGQLADLHPDGFLLRSTLTVDVLGEAIDRMYRGELPIPSAIVRALLHKTRTQAGQPVTPSSRALLTAREQQTLELLAQGCSNKQIALRLGVSPNGAKRYVASILAKLNCPNRTLAVAWALKSGLISQPGNVS